VEVFHITGLVVDMEEEEEEEKKKKKKKINRRKTTWSCVFFRRAKKTLAHLAAPSVLSLGSVHAATRLL
jgi:hypothetical protein